MGYVDPGELLMDEPRPWTEGEDRMLRRHWGQTDILLIAEAIGRKPSDVRARGAKLGLKMGIEHHPFGRYTR